MIFSNNIIFLFNFPLTKSEVLQTKLAKFTDFY